MSCWDICKCRYLLLPNVCARQVAMSQTSTTGCLPYRGQECFHVTTPPGVLVFGGQTRELLYPTGTGFLYSLGGDSTTLAHRVSVDGFSALGPASHTTVVGEGMARA